MPAGRFSTARLFLLGSRLLTRFARRSRDLLIVAQVIIQQI
jgi:hypothetical protein